MVGSDDDLVDDGPLRIASGVNEERRASSVTFAEKTGGSIV